MGLKENIAFCSKSKKAYKRLSKSSLAQLKFMSNFSLKCKH